MNLLAELLEREESRLKRIDENPDATRLQSNRLGFELERDLYRELLEAWQTGKPLLPYFPSATLARALGSQSVVYEGLVPNFPEEAPRYMRAVRNMGLLEYICDAFTLANVASMLGELPPPSIGAVCSGGTCRVWPYHLKALAEHFAVPTFEIDTPHEYSEESIKYLAVQLGDLVKFVESKVPGLNYNEDRHMELIEANRIFVEYCKKEWELRKNVPFPLDSIDSFRQPFHREPNIFSNTTKALGYWRLRVEEIEERVNKGINKEERLRFLWIWGGPVYINPIAQLEPRGVSVPAVILPPAPLFNGRIANWGDDMEFGRKLSPFEEEARFLIGTGICRSGRGWVDEVLWTCRDLGCDGIIYYQLKGCVHVGTLARLVADAALKKLGVNTLVISGRLMDSSSLSPEDFESRIVEFVNMVLNQKK